MGSRQDRDYEYIQVTLGIKKAKFPVEMELFPPNQSGGKELFGSQLIGPQGDLIYLDVKFIRDKSIPTIYQYN